MKQVEQSCRLCVSEAGTTYMIDCEKKITKCLQCGALANFISESIKSGECCTNRRVADTKDDRNPTPRQ